VPESHKPIPVRPVRPPPDVPPKKREWARPAVTELPKLNELTLQSGEPIPGGPSVFG
jgi:hypothetical protein